MIVSLEGNSIFFNDKFKDRSSEIELNCRQFGSFKDEVQFTILNTENYRKTEYIYLLKGKDKLMALICMLNEALKRMGDE